MMRILGFYADYPSFSWILFGCHIGGGGGKGLRLTEMK
jgi:hypothetical protein